MGGVDIHGLGVYRLYFREALAKLSVNYNIFRVGTYKSALEPFIRDDMSPEDREQNKTWLSALWQVYTGDITAQRKLAQGALENYTNDISSALAATHGDTAELARKTGLIDEIWSRPQTAAYVAELAKTSEKKLHTITFNDYYSILQPSSHSTAAGDGKVGLIVAEGTMLPGKQPPGLIGGDSLTELLKKAKEDDEIKALVLRINSGGGSALAAEVIRQEILEVKKKGKPVVISMGTVAASGGYWIAADADQIWASDTTITGSIGIFGAIPTFEKSLASLGVHADGTGTTPLASGLDLTQPLPEQLKGAIQQAINFNYDQFLDIVAKGRKLEKSRVEELAEGKVYDGKAAQSLGLVDKLGTLDGAIEAAASLAGLKEYETEYINPPETVKQQLLEFFAGFMPMPEETVGMNAVLSRLKKSIDAKLGHYLLLDDPRGIYAHCPISPKF
jgi:protease-4